MESPDLLGGHPGRRAGRCPRRAGAQRPRRARTRTSWPAPSRRPARGCSTPSRTTPTPPARSGRPSCAEQVLDVVRDHGAFLVEDDWAHDFGITTDAAPVAAHDDAGHVVYLRSLTKSVSPAMRVAAVIARGPARERILADRGRRVDVRQRPAPGGRPRRRHPARLADPPARRARSSSGPAATCWSAACASTPRRPTSSTCPTGGLNLWVRLPDGTDLDQARPRLRARRGRSSRRGPSGSRPSRPGRSSGSTTPAPTRVLSRKARGSWARRSTAPPAGRPAAVRRYSGASSAWGAASVTSPARSGRARRRASQRRLPEAGPGPRIRRRGCHPSQVPRRGSTRCVAGRGRRGAGCEGPGCSRAAGSASACVTSPRRTDWYRSESTCERRSVGATSW